MVRAQKAETELKVTTNTPEHPPFHPHEHTCIVLAIVKFLARQQKYVKKEGISMCKNVTFYCAALHHRHQKESKESNRKKKESLLLQAKKMTLMAFHCSLLLWTRFSMFFLSLWVCVCVYALFAIFSVCVCVYF